MKNRPKELDVDFIGGQGPLTKEEEKRISEYIKAKKKIRATKTSTSARRKVVA